jgi:menaquinone-dependent protoporphyrinogen oxidase
MTTPRYTRRRFLACSAAAAGAATLACIGPLARPVEGARNGSFISETEESTTMASRHILVAYATRCGSSRDIAEAIGEELRLSGATVDVVNVKEKPSLQGYDALVLGGGVRVGKLFGEASRFAKRNAAALATMPIAYFAVCGAMKEPTPENLATAQGYLAPLLAVREPVSAGLFAGAIMLETMGPVMRFMFSKAQSKDPSALGDYRDWDAIRAWARELAPKLAAA